MARTRVKFIAGVAAVGALIFTTPQARAHRTCATLTGGSLAGPDGTPLAPGFDQWGYNYQAHMFKGTYCAAYRNAAWCQRYADVELAMKWNDAFLSNTDCTGDGLLDRAADTSGSYIGSGAWLTNHQSGWATDEHGELRKWTYFVKVVAATPDAKLVDGVWYRADGTSLGARIWRDFAIEQEILNDPTLGFHGRLHGLVVAPGFGPVAGQHAPPGAVLAVPETISGGWAHTCGVSASSAAYCWGSNTSGQLGDGTNDQHDTPAAVSGGIAFEQITAGAVHSCGLTGSGAVHCWGSNEWGQLGDGTQMNRSTPVLASGEIVFQQISAGWNHTCGLTASGAAYCWGRNGAGQVGDGTAGYAATRVTPTPVLGGLVFEQIGAGGDHTCGIVASGAAYCWGSNAHGELGDGTTTDRDVPTAVTGRLAFSQISPGYVYTCAVTTSGAGECWGDNFNGQLGIGTLYITYRTSPTAVGGKLGFAQISAGDYHACALTTSGAAYCWGNNNDGELGDGTTVERTSPVAVSGGLTFERINAGSAQTCALVASSGDAYCWGANESGELGDGTNTQRLVPTAVAGGLIF